MSNTNPNPNSNLPNSNSPLFPSRISKAALDAAQYAQQQYDTISALLGDTAYSIAMSTDVTHLLKDAAYYASDEAVKHVNSASKALSTISADVMREIIQSAQGVVDARIPQSAIDNIALINTAVESIKGIQFDTIAAKHLTVNYEQYKPVVDALEALQHDNNNDIPFDFTTVHDSSEVVTDDNVNAIKEHKPVSIIVIISLILNIYSSYLGTYTNFLKPSLAGEQLQIEKDQLTQLQSTHSETVRHNTITEEQNNQTLILLGKMYELLIDLTSTANSDTDSQNETE